MPKRGKPILCVDFDGVIHGYDSGWKGARRCDDPPVPGAALFLLKAVQHFQVAVLSSRSHQWGGRRAMKRYIRQLLWDGCLAHTDEMQRAWTATQGRPAEWIPWTAYDVRDVADHIHKAISYPLFKPPATVTIDDRAIHFDGDWSRLDPKSLLGFRPWNKQPRMMDIQGPSEGRDG